MTKKQVFKLLGVTQRKDRNNIIEVVKACKGHLSYREFYVITCYLILMGITESEKIISYYERFVTWKLSRRNKDVSSQDS